MAHGDVKSSCRSHQTLMFYILGFLVRSHVFHELSHILSFASLLVIDKADIRDISFRERLPVVGSSHRWG